MDLVTLNIMCLPIPEFLPPLSPYVLFFIERLLGICVAGRWFLLHAALLQHKNFIVWGIIRLLSIQPHGLKPGSIQQTTF